MKFPLKRHVNLDTKPFVLVTHSRFLGVRFILCQPRLHNRIFMNTFLKVSQFLDSNAWERLSLCLAQLFHILSGILEILINQFFSKRQSVLLQILKESHTILYVQSESESSSSSEAHYSPS